MKNLRKILLPISWCYKEVMRLRNAAYDKGWFTSQDFEVPIIGIGNLSTGGTGKSPMTEYIIRLVRKSYLPATLSRGYGRNTSGFLEVKTTSKAREVGDEPLQFKHKFPEIPVVVDEKRVHAIEKMLKDGPTAEVFVLDDVFQHRSVKPSFVILLTSYDALFYEDCVLPAGNLRESRMGARRAGVVVITKCPPELNRTAREIIAQKVKKYTKAPVFFSSISYDPSVRGKDKIPLGQLQETSLTVVTGIAKPEPFIAHLKENGLTFDLKTFPDHHNFSNNELAVLDELPVILTTEKDYMRLKGTLKKARLYYLPIRFSFLAEAEQFERLVFDAIEKNRPARD